MDLLVALAPSVLYGFTGIVIVKIGGDNRQQTIGQLGGGFLVGLVLVALVGLDLPFKSAVIAFLLGVALALGIQYQLKAFSTIGVSRAMPITTGGQLVGISFLGVALFGEWIGSLALPVGFVGVALVVAGVVLTSYTDKEKTGAEDTHGSSKKGHLEKVDWPRGLAQITFATVLIIVYIVGLRWFDIDPIQGYFPVMAGCFATGLVVTSPWFTPEQGKADTRFQRRTLALLIPGVMWGLGVILMTLSQVRVGVALGFTFSQLGVIISTFGGILILHETRTRKEMNIVVLGVIILVLGAVVLGVAKAIDAA